MTEEMLQQSDQMDFDEITKRITGISKQDLNDFMARKRYTEVKASEDHGTFEVMVNKVEDYLSIDNLDRLDLMEYGIYSPVQVELLKILEETRKDTLLQFPFCFKLVGAYIQNYLNTSKKRDIGAPSYSRLLQSIFYLRETREEQHRLSLEVKLPYEDDEKSQDKILTDQYVKLKKLSQVFGRGIGKVVGEKLHVFYETSGLVKQIFTSHTTAPLSALYSLDGPSKGFEADDLMDLTLRNDGVISLSTPSNPLLDFYDGSWHVVDINSSRIVYQLILEKEFETYEEDLKSLVDLAYHLGSHWHGAILAVMREQNDEEKKKLFQSPSDEIMELNRALKESIKKLTKQANIRKIKEKGLGRLLLSSSIQDGAVIFNPQGDLIDVGALAVVDNGKSMKGGARTHAARKLALAGGVVLKVSQDGEIKLFSRKLPEKRDHSLRIR